MRKSLLLTACLVAVVSVLISAPVDTLTGLRVASNFYCERAGVQQSRSISTQLVKTYKTLPSEARDSLNCLYIYNVGDGYVIVSADDRITPVLGYSTEGNFDVQHIPVQLQEWLSQYTARIGAAVSSPGFTNEPVNSSWRTLASDHYTPSRYGTVLVAPLIQTLWDQYPYYNNYCPYNTTANQRTVTGCVATAMAQLIRYWQYPSRGIGSHSYTHYSYGFQSADFGNTTYNYSLMPLSLNSSSSAAEINEVAKLMYHCGVSVDMDYGLGADGGSGASTQDAANAFNTYFGYSGCQYANKSSYTNNQWKNKLKTELNNGRPVLYDGSGTGGHAFICDGYTVDDYFHFNFGWSGSFNGYFTLDDITPGSYNFNYTQGGIFNLSAALPILRASESEVDFLTESGAVSEGRKINVISNNLSNPISITTSSPFSVSTDSVHYGNSITMGTGGGYFFVKYSPNTGIQRDSSSITLVSGSTTTSIVLRGFTFLIDCQPVNNLNISSSDLSHINIAWTEPQMDTTPQILTWNNAKTTNYSFNDNKVTLLHRFTTADLASHHNQTLTGISFYVSTGFSVLRLVVYKGSDFRGTSFNPGTLIVEENIPVSSLTENSWNTFTLSHPVTIDAHEELCFGVYMESSYAYPIPVGSPIVAKKGSIIGYASGGGGQSWSQISNYSVCLRGIVQSTQNLTHYEVTRDGMVLGTTTGTSYNDLVSHTDTYHYTVTALWDNGCSADANLDFTNVASITTNPRVLEFHNNYGFNNEVKTIQVGGNGISQPIQVSVSGNFQISTNGTSYSSSATLSSSGGVLYVKYTPTSPSTPFESGQINLSSGAVSARVSLTGQCYGDCNPPQNLTLSVPSSGTTVTATWNTPDALSANTYDLTWHVANINSFTRYSSLSIYNLQRFDPSDLAAYHNKKITSISFIPNTDYLTACKVVVFKGGTYTSSSKNPGTLVTEQVIPVSSLTDWVWNTITLNTPVVIDANQEIWFGIYLTYSQDCSSTRYGSTGTTNKSAIYGDGTYWNSNNSRSFAIKASVEDVLPTFDHYQIDRNGSTLVNSTSSNHYTDNVMVNGDYNYTVWAIWSNGCQAGASGSVSITGGCNVTGTATTVAECGSYTWSAGNGQTYTTSGTYLHSHTLSTGCIQVDTLYLTIKPIPIVTISGNTNIHRYESTTLTASGASSYVWSTGSHNSSITVSPASTTTYYVTGTTNGCSSTPASVTVNVSACIPAQGVETVIACGSYTWHGHTYTASTTTPTYTIPNGAASGCDSIVTLHLTIKPIPVVTISGNTNIHRYESTTLTASGANSYVWSTGSHNNAITVSPAITTTYYVTGTTNGCSSTPASVTVNVSSCIPAQGVETVTACGSYTWHGHTYTASTSTPTYTIPNGAASGCDSIVTLHLTIKPIPVVTISGNTNIHRYESTTLTASGANSYSWSTGASTNAITVSPAITTTYYVTGTTNGCSSAPASVTVNVSACIPAQGVETVTACGSYTWHGHTYTASTTTPTYTIPNGAASGCDSIVTLHLTIKPIPVVTISGNTNIHRYESTTLTASGASSYSWSTGSHNSAITVAPIVTTTYSVTGTTDGCASAPASVTVTVGDCIPLYHIETVTACNSYTWQGITYTESTNTPTHTFPNAASNGCDSVVNLHLIIIHSTNNSIYINECGSYTWCGTTYTTSGTYTHEYSDPLGCTIVDTLHLTITPIPVVTISGDTNIFLHESTTIMASGAESYIWSNGLSSTGFVAFPTTTTTYTVTGFNSWCASDPVSITVHVQDCIPAQGVETVTACGSYIWHGQIYTTSTSTATYTIPGGAANGCDSIVTLHLTIHKPAHNAITVSECGRYTWSSGNGQTYTQSGTYLHTHTDVNGCTQVDTLHLTINPIPLVTITGNTSIPLYESTTLTAHGATSYTWSNGSHASAITVSPASATTYSVTGTTNGCTGTPASVTVVVGPCQPKQGVETVTACGSYIWHGHTYTASTNTPTYTIPGGAATGCDSVVTLHLTIKPVPVVTVTGNIAILIDQSTTLTAHGASSYTWSNGSHASAITVSPDSTTTYSVVGTLGDCTSAPASVTVNVSACLPGQHEETITACDSYTWTSGNGQTYNESTNVTHTIPNGAANGCDSILTLHLFVRHPAKEYTVVTGCGSYTWNGIIYTQSGTYTFNHTDNYGCILRDTLVLTIKPKPVVTVTGNTSILASQSTTLTAQGAISYVWSNSSQTNTITVSPTDTTIYTVIGTTDGCSSDPVRVTVNVSPCTPAQGVEVVTACDSYTWHGRTFYESTDTATYTIPGGAANGCDSIVTLHLTVRHPENEYSVITECGNFTWNGTTYTQSGTYTYSHTDSYGCTQMDTLVLTITPIPVVTITGNSSINLNESTTLTVHGSANMYVWSNGSRASSITVSPTSTTTYTVLGISNGCTSEPASFTVNVITCTPVQSVETVSACGSYTWHGRTFYESTDTATYTIPNGSADGCDSTVTLHLTIHNPVHTAVTVSECGSYTWTSGNGQTYTASGHYTYSHSDAHGCTQVDTLHLTIKPIPVVTISGNNNIHLYESTTLTAHGANSYSWSTGASTGAITVSPAATTTYSVTGTTNGCASAPASVTVNVGSCIPGQGVETVTACGSYTWHGTTYTASTSTATHTIPGGAATGCDSIVTLHLTIKPIPVVTISGNNNIHLYESTTLTASGANSYVWSTGASTNAITVSPASTTTYSVTGTTDGCASAPASVTVNVGPCIPGQGVETVTACGSYTWHGHTYTASTSTATHTIPGGAATGCDSIVTLHLTIKPIPVVTISGNNNIHLYESTTLTASGANSYSWSTGANTNAITVSPAITTTYSVTGTTDGCTSAPASLTVNVGPCIPGQGVETVTACGSYTWHGHTYTACTNTATHTIPGGAATGCDSIVTLHLTIKPIPVVTISGNNDIHLYESTTLTASGANSYSWSTGNHTSAITVSPATTTTYFVTGTTDGCVSAPASITVNVGPCIPGQGVETVTTCESYTWHGHTYTASTSTATHTIPGGAATGCDSIVTLHLTIHNPTHTATSITECESYTWNGTTYRSSGHYTYAHPDAQGCIQVDTLHLTLHHPVHTAVTVTECNSYTWHGTTYSTSGDYYYDHNDNHGCTQVDTLHLTIHHPQHSSTSVNSCGSYIWNGTTYSTSGVYTYAHSDANGCTQVDTLHLNVRPKPVVSISGETYIHLYESSTLTASGADSYVWSTGEHTNPITVSPTSAMIYSVTGSSNGCTSEPAHITIIVGPCIPAQGVETITACESFTWHGTTYTESTSIPTFTIPGGAATGCDSVVTLHLTIHHVQHATTTASECGSYTWASGDGQTYTQSGTYLHSHTDANGCTQVDTLHLTIKPIPDVTITGNGFIHLYESTTLTAHGADSYVWSTGANTDAITVSPASATTYSVTGYADGCTSAPASITINVGACIPAQGVETVTACGSYTWYGQTYTANNSTATHTIIGGAATGCDSIVTLHLTVFHPQHTATTANECGSYTWTSGDGQTYTQSGTYLHSHTDANGCTQVDTLHLTIRPVPVVSISGNTAIHLYESTTLTASGADSYSWSTGASSDAITVSPATTTTYSVTGAADGCTSAPASVTVTVGPCIPAQGVETVTACENYTWHGQTYYESTDTATHTVIGGAATGCDSIVTLHLTIHHAQHTATTASECGNYIWSAGDGQTYNQSGTYLYSHTDTNGCTQVDTLLLTIFEPQSSEFTVATEDSCYDWNGTEYCENGDFTQTLTDQFGCDSTVTLHLTLRVGITQYDEQYNISIYPNPTTSILYIESDAQIGQIHLYNTFGQKIKSIRVDGTKGSLDLSDLATGAYYLRVETDKGIVVKKVIRNK